MVSGLSEELHALVARDLSRYDVDIAAISETRLAGEGQLTEHGAGYALHACRESHHHLKETGSRLLLTRGNGERTTVILWPLMSSTINAQPVVALVCPALGALCDLYITISSYFFILLSLSLYYLIL